MHFVTGDDCIEVGSPPDFPAVTLTSITLSFTDTDDIMTLDPASRVPSKKTHVHQQPTFNSPKVLDA